MATRENKFMKASPSRGSIDLRQVAKGVNDINTGGHNVTVNSEKQVEDINISLIDEYDKNESLFGYNNLEAVKRSIKKTGSQGVAINVFKKDNGRYLCYSGNTRLKAMRELGERKITCIIEGPVPDEHELMIRVIRGNTQRECDPYHIAIEIEEVEKSFREKGLVGAALTDEIESVTGYKLTAQKLYKQIRKLDPSLQELFNNLEVPYRPLLEVCKKLPEDRVSDFLYLYELQAKESEMTGETIRLVFESTMKDDRIKHSNDNLNPKLSRVFKDILALSTDKNGDYYIPKSRRKKYLEQIEQLEKELTKLKTACKKEE